jgi:hypothetical protein
MIMPASSGLGRVGRARPRFAADVPLTQHSALSTQHSGPDLWAAVEMLGLQHVNREAIERKKYKVTAYIEFAKKIGTCDR